MVKIIKRTLWSAGIALFLIGGFALGQQVDSTQVKTKTSGGLTGDSNNALAVVPPRATSAPGTPLTGQLYCDTNTTPCILKMYNGSTWENLSAQNPSYGATAASFPSNPVTGQLYYTQSPSTLWVYDAAVSGWRAMLTSASYATGNLLITTCTNTPLPTPTPTPAVTPATSGGSMACSGSYSYKIAYVNATGGETTLGPVSGTAAIGTCSSVGSVNLTSIPTGPTGTSGRSIYRSKINTQVAGPWYFDHQINDNSTTTYLDVTNDTGITLPSAPYNLSGALPANWAVVGTVTPNTGTQGGAGCTTAGGFAAWQGGIAQYYSSGATTDGFVLTYPISSYTSGNFTLMWRVTQFSYTSAANPANTIGIRKDTNTNSIYIGVGHYVNQFPIANYTGCIALDHGYRSTAGGAVSAGGFKYSGGYPICSVPFWERIIGHVSVPTSGYNYWISQDGNLWIMDPNNNNTTPQTMSQYVAGTYAGYPANYFFMKPEASGSSQYSSYLEVDTITVTTF